MPTITETIKVRIVFVCGDREFNSIEEFTKAFIEGIEGEIIVHGEVINGSKN